MAVIFSPIGNKILQIYLQKELQNANIPLKIESFYATPWSIKAAFTSLDILEIDNSITPIATLLENNATHKNVLPNDSMLPIVIDMEGSHWFFIKDINVDIVASFDAISSKVRFNLPPNFFLRANVIGNWDNLRVQGNSNFLGGDWNFNAHTQEDRLVEANITSRSARLSQILLFFNKAPFAESFLDANVTMFRDNENVLVGDIEVLAQKGYVDTKILERNFGLKVNKVGFNSLFSGKLKNLSFDYQLHGNSNIGSLNIDGSTALKTYATNLKHRISIKDLSPLTPLVTFPVRGYFGLNGEIKGDLKNFLGNGESRIGNSQINYEFLGKNMTLTMLKVQSVNTQMEDLLKAIEMPPYLSGSVDISADLRELHDWGSGNITINSKNLIPNSPLLEQHITLGIPATRFAINLQATLDRGIGLANAEIQSNIFEANATKIQLDIKPPLALSIPVIAKMPRLENLSFRGKSILKGSATAFGAYRYQSPNSTSNFNVSFLSSSGKEDSQLFITSNNEQWQVDAKHLDTMWLLEIFNAPKLAVGFLDGTLLYNNEKKEGTLSSAINDAKLIDGFYLREIQRYGDKNIKNIKNKSFDLLLSSAFDNNRSFNTLQICSKNGKDSKLCIPYLEMSNFNLTHQKERVIIEGNMQLYDNKKTLLGIEGDWKSPKITRINQK